MRLRDCDRVGSSHVVQVDAKALQPLWISDYHDGPISGAVIFESRFCWYVCAEEEQPPYREGWYRRYWLVVLTPEQEAEERRWHDLFRLHVGTHWDHPAGAEPGRVRPTENHHLFYDAYSERTPLVIDDNDVIAWFQF